MTTQWEQALPVKMQTYGCYFLCMERIVEIIEEREITVPEITTMYFDLTANGQIDQDCYLKDPTVVANAFFRLLAAPHRLVQIGAVYGTEKAEFWPSSLFFQALDNKTAAGNKHFQLGDASGNMIYDPRPGTPLVGLTRRVVYHVVIA